MELQQIIGILKESPQVKKAVDALEAQLARAPIMPEDIDPIIGMLEAVIADPNRYAEVRAAAIEDGFINEQDAPPEFDPVFVVSLLVALVEYRDRLSTQGYARGGLRVAGRQIAAAGRGGDSLLAHINPREAEMLRRMGGAGTINPNTGLQEYKSGGSILAALIPLALNFIAPGVGGILGTFLTGGGALATGVAPTMFASVLGNAAIGGASAAIGGGNPQNILQGAVTGGILGGVETGLPQLLGESATSALGLPDIGATGQKMLGGGALGAAGALITGKNPLTGAVMGVVGGGLPSLVQNAAGPDMSWLNKAAGTTGAGLIAGQSPRDALVAGGLTGLYTAIAPSDVVVNGVDEKRYAKNPDGSPIYDALNRPELDLPDSKTPRLQLAGGQRDAVNGVEGNWQLNTTTGKHVFKPTEFTYSQSADGTVTQTQTRPSLWDRMRYPNGVPPTTPGVAGAPSKGGGLAALAIPAALAVAATLTRDSPEVTAAIGSLPADKRAELQPVRDSLDWSAINRAAVAQNQSLPQFMAENWAALRDNRFNMPATAAAMAASSARPGPIAYAKRGGALGNIAMLARGSGSGRADTINARLSDGEYVMDAETVALLGDGSTDEGARRLDDMRMNLRKHKGKALTQGRFSPGAKSPLNYLRGVA